MGLFDKVKDVGKNLLGGAAGGNPLGGLVGGLLGGGLGLLGGGKDGKMPDWLEDYYKGQIGAATDIMEMPAPEVEGAPYAGVGWGNQQLRNMMPGFLNQQADLFGMADQSGRNAYTQMQSADPNLPVVSSSGVIGQAENFMNPYTERVIDAVQGDLDLARREAIQQGENARLSSGTYGGGRHGVADSLLNRDYLNTLASTTAGLRQGGMDRALGLAMQNIARQQGTRQNIFGNKLNRAGMLGDLSQMYAGQGGQRFALGAGIAGDEQARSDMHAEFLYDDAMRKELWPITALQASQGMAVPQQMMSQGGSSGWLGNALSGAMMGAAAGNQIFGGDSSRRLPGYFGRVADAGIGLGSFLNFG